MPLHDRESFETIYAGKPAWDIGKPQPMFVAVADRVTGDVLDAGCGTGENALFLAGRGHDVFGIDFLEGPIQEARRKAHERGLNAEFACMDALTLGSSERRFDTVIDCGLFHVFSDEDRARYVAGLTHVTRPGGLLMLLCFSDAEPGTQGPRRVSQDELRNAFANGWKIEAIRPERFEIRPDLEEVRFSAGGPKAWLALVLRQG